MKEMSHGEAIFHEETVFAYNNCLRVVMEGPFPAKDAVWMAVWVCSAEKTGGRSAKARLAAVTVFGQNTNKAHASPDTEAGKVWSVSIELFIRGAIIRPMENAVVNVSMFREEIAPIMAGNSACGAGGTKCIACCTERVLNIGVVRVAIRCRVLDGRSASFAVSFECFSFVFPGLVCAHIDDAIFSTCSIRN